MKKRLKENAMLIILCIVIICCTVCVCNKVDSAKDNVIVWIKTVIEDKSSYEQVSSIHEDLSDKIDIVQATVEGIIKRDI
jgi:hypothetical protein